MVHTFITKLIPHLKESQPNLKKIHYFTDGCVGQYKNKYNFKNLCYLNEDFGLDCEWNFFATSHGKSACDGIGRTIKEPPPEPVCREFHQGKFSHLITCFAFVKKA
jgi:hypothetical protein